MGDWYEHWCESARKRSQALVKNEVGHSYGKLTVLAPALSTGHGARWVCKCDCGKEIVAVSGNLVDGKTRSCGCLRGVLQSKDETGNRYGMLTVIGSAPSEGKGSRWVCECDCGNTVTVLGSNLRKGHHKSCGCLRSRKVTTDG